MNHKSRTAFRRLPGAALVVLAAVSSAQLASAANLLDNSAALERWSSFRGARAISDAGAAPDGSQTADQVVDSTTENGARIFSNTVVADGGPYVFSCYLKSGTLTQAKLTIADGTGSSVRAYIQPTLSAQWQRYVVSIPSSPSGSTLRVELYPGKFDKDNGYVWAWGAQLESGKTPTAYTGGSGGDSPSDTTPPAAPTGLSAQVSSGSVQVRWTANTEGDLAGYRLERSVNGAAFTQVATPGTADYTDSAVTAGSTYQYRVAAVDRSGNVSGFSSAASVTVPKPADTTAPAAPSGLNGSLSSGTISLRWNANAESDLAGYRLERGVNSTTNFSALAAPTGTSYTDSSVQAGSSYSYRVRAVDATGNVSAPSAVVTVTVPAANPTPTGALNAADFGANPATSGDDTAALQAACNAAASQGKDLYLPAGYYWLSSTLVFRAHGRTFYGAGLDKTIVAGNTGSYNLLQLDRTRDVTVRDLRFEGNHLNSSDTANTGKAVECYATQGTHIQRIYTYGTGYIAFDNGGVNTTLEDSVCEDYGRIGYLINDGGTVRRCRFQNRDGWRMTSEMQGIYAAAGRENILIEDCEFINAGIYAIQLWGSQNGVYTQNVTIQRNTFTRCPRVLVCAAGDSGPLYRNIRFVGNTIRGTQEKSLHIGKYNGSTADGTELLIEGNVFEDAGPGYGIFLTPWGGAALQGIRIRNNQFLAPNRSSYNGFVHVAGAKDVIIENNTFSGIGHDGSSEIVSEGIHLKSGSQIAIRDNYFEHWSGAGQGRVVNAIRFETSTTGVAIERNQFIGNGRPYCYGLNVQSSASSVHGYVRDCVFRRAKFYPNGLPNSGNVVE